MAKGTRLKVGDKVIWRGAWGGDAPQEAIVESIQLCANGSKYGKDVQSADWSVVREGRKIVVDLDNGHWAYGDQLKPIS